VQPILASSCALATTAAEARYRIDAPIAGRRGARVLALDDRATSIVHRAAQQVWNGARFFVLAVPPAATGVALTPDADGATDLLLSRTNGTSSRLSDELAEADVAVMVATIDGDRAAAEAIGRACSRRGIMTAGLVVGDHKQVEVTVSRLRPHAQVLLVTRDEQDLVEILTALRA